VEGIIEAGRVLIEAKNELEHGQFTDWVVRELRFDSRKNGSCEADLRKAEMLMFLARKLRVKIERKSPSQKRERFVFANGTSAQLSCP
jgi:hypothetical protein